MVDKGFVTALAQKFNEQRAPQDHSTQTDANSPTGGISIEKGLLPSAQVGQTITMEVTSVDDKTVYLKIVR